MAQIKCPECGKVFEVAETDYQRLLDEVKNSAFNEELHERLAQKEETYKKDLENVRLKAERDQEIKIRELESKLKKSEYEKELLESKHKQEVLEALQKEKDKISELEIKLQSQKSEAEKDIRRLEDQRKFELEQKENEIAQLKDYKAKLSVKMIGESLEQHCEMEFNKYRMGLCPHAYFEKDSEIVGGTKGDYIFREIVNESEELLSIMFEMKNESEVGDNKKKNDDHLKKLDEDRRKKNCEYAILVSTLEPENEFYNGGIVDMSYKYEKMYVIRPQFFIPIITILRNAALKTVNDKNEIALLKNREIDVTNFENKLSDFQKGFNTSYERASKKFDAVIDELNKTIDHLVKTRDALMQTGTNFRIANDKVQEITISKLTYGNPTMKAKFEEAKLLDAKDED